MGKIYSLLLAQTPVSSILPHSLHTFDLSRGRGGNILGSEKSSLTNLLSALLLPFIWAGEGSDALWVAKLVPISQQVLLMV